MNWQVFLAFVLAYFIGAIPFSIWIGKKFYGVDVRTSGSGNAGATNTFRVLGTQAGILVLTLDILKGVLAVLLANWLGSENFSFEQMLYYRLGLGIMAAIGHIFPVYLNFKGGKGVATFFGVVIAIFPWAALICMGIFFLIFYTSHYVSLGSIIAALAFPFGVLFVQHVHNAVILIAVFLIPVIIFYTHRKNIGRLVSGTENKISFHKTSPVTKDSES
jgi:acyl phosphate:glycerol-3-phosphate acyltransferase